MAQPQNSEIFDLYKIGNFNTSPTLFTTTTSDLANKLLSYSSLTYGIEDTGIIGLGTELTTVNFSGKTYGVTLSSSDNSSSLATTAFVKEQTAVAAAWSALNTFSSGIISSKYDALNVSSTLSVGSNVTTGTVILGPDLNSTGRINMGSATSITNISNLSCNNLSCQTIEPIVDGGIFGIGANQMNGLILLADGFDRLGNVKIGNRISGPGVLSLGDNMSSASILIGNNAIGTGLSTINIGTNLYTTTKLSGSINVYNPITVGYSVPAKSLASLAYIGGAYTVNSRFEYDITTFTKAQAPINNIPTGRYCLSMYVYVTQTSPVARYETKIAYNSTPITINSSTGFNTSSIGVLETYTYKPNNTTAMSITSTSFFEVTADITNIAIGCSTTSNSNGTCVFTLTACRV